MDFYKALPKGLFDNAEKKLQEIQEEDDGEKSQEDSEVPAKGPKAKARGGRWPAKGPAANAKAGARGGKKKQATRAQSTRAERMRQRQTVKPAPKPILKQVRRARSQASPVK